MRHLLSVLACVLAAGAPTTGHALQVLATATPLGGGAFHYAFSVVNDGPDDIVLVTRPDAPSGDALIAATLAAPSGYAAVYDDLLGILDFVEDTSLFAASTTTEFFSFDSGAAPSAGFFADFQAVTVDLDLIEGSVVLVPEPGSLALLALGLVALAAGRGERREVSR